ncbi:GNAT family N-acetyltransferase [Palleronia abyssalis]|uniref:N-acetyltransferase domain-containing protein n=1 Tax=Palleronia abyssalis TaxID=1501240 RepID=A0A2R8BXB9_9RHOB|nr:GNAT family N-acetyltransferase [Palleronia abyssalis]SPJ24824.1 hypothetical protein PAA8504_02663 [Palleronia abyssalis]
MSAASALTWKEGDPPIVGEYLELREAAGYGRASAGSVAKALSGSIHCVTAKDGARLIAIGRVVGDWGLRASIVDLTVHPDFNLDVVGKEALDRLLHWCDETLPRSCAVELLPEPGRFSLYRSAGFEITTGMRLIRP